MDSGIDCQPLATSSSQGRPPKQRMVSENDSSDYDHTDDLNDNDHNLHENDTFLGP